MTTPVLETPRLLLRPLSVSDAPRVYESWTSDPEVARFMIWDLHESLDDTLAWLTAEETNLDDDGSYVWGFVLKETGLLVGSGGLQHTHMHGCFELGYNLMRDCWGMGLTTEASRAMLAFARDVLGERRIFCRHALENNRSRRVIEKLGFRRTGEGYYQSFSGRKEFACLEYELVLAPYDAKK